LLGDKDVLWRIRVGCISVRRADHLVAPSINKLASFPRRMGGPASAGVSKRTASPPAPMVLKRLVARSERARNRPKTLAVGKPSFNLIPLRRHGRSHDKDFTSPLCHAR
jgi:hypothetical protein